MKSSRAWLTLGCALVLMSSALAQEVTVGEPRLYPGHAPMDTLPQAKARLRVDFPDEMKTSEDPEYGLIIRYVDSSAQSRFMHSIAYSAPYERELRDSYGVRRWPAVPGTIGGKPASGAIFLTVIFNPPASNRRRENARPRLVAAEPVFLPVERGQKKALPVKFTLDAAGSITGMIPPVALTPPLQAAFDRAAAGFRFEPALKDGKPVAGEVTVPMLIVDSEPIEEPKVVLPKVVKQEPPVYPISMRRFGLTGQVVIRFQVDETGVVRNPYVQQSTNPAFDVPAIQAVRKWRFQPAKRNGATVTSEMMVPIMFELEGVPSEEPFHVSVVRDQSKLPPELRYDAPPKIRHVSVPVYPYALLRDRIKGKAKVRMLIDRQGKIAAVHLVSATHPEFGAALVAAVEEFEFDPAMNKGKTVPHLLNFEHEFDSGTIDSSSSDLVRDEMKHPERIAGASKLDSIPNPISRRAPRFPLSVAETVAEGQATIEFLIDDEGLARLPRIVKASDPAFGYAAVQAVSTWAFDPPTTNSRKTQARVAIPFQFKREQ